VVVVILPSLKSGGTEWQVYWLLRELTGCQAICLWVYDVSTVDSPLAQLFRSISGLHIIFGSSLRSIGSVSRLRPGLVLSYAINYYVPEILLKLFTGATLISERRNLYHWMKTRRRRRFQERLRNFLTTKIICNSKAVADNVAIYEPEVQAKVEIIYNGVVSFPISKLPRRSIVAVANVKQGKGLEKVIEVFRSLKCLNNNNELLSMGIYGRLDDPKVFADADPAFLAEVYKGERHREIIFSSALCILHLSENEGFPNVVLEAASAGVIPVLSDIPIHRELFEGCAFFVRDVPEAVATIQYILRCVAGNPLELSLWTDRCTQLARSYSLEQRASQYRRIFNAHSD